jgi:hypothetical protein
MLAITPSILDCYKPRVESISVSFGSNCEPIITCKSDSADSNITWFSIKNKLRHNLNDSDFIILKHGQSSTLYLTRNQSENQKFYCEVNGATTHSEINLDVYGCYNEESFILPKSLISFYVINVVVITTTIAICLIYAICLVRRRREERHIEDNSVPDKTLQPPAVPVRSSLLTPYFMLPPPPLLPPPPTPTPQLEEITQVPQNYDFNSSYSMTSQSVTNPYYTYDYATFR